MGKLRTLRPPLAAIAGVVDSRRGLMGAYTRPMVPLSPAPDLSAHDMLSSLADGGRLSSSLPPTKDKFVTFPGTPPQRTTGVIRGCQGSRSNWAASAGVARDPARTAGCVSYNGRGLWASHGRRPRRNFRGMRTRCAVPALRPGPGLDISAVPGQEPVGEFCSHCFRRVGKKPSGPISGAGIHTIIAGDGAV